MTLPNQVQIRILASGIYPAPQFPPDIARALDVGDIPTEAFGPRVLR
jgi:hypothetical protein